jgi:hypothetical protein
MAAVDMEAAAIASKPLRRIEHWEEAARIVRPLSFALPLKALATWLQRSMLWSSHQQR